MSCEKKPNCFLWLVSSIIRGYIGSWEMQLGANGSFMKISKSAGSMQWMICWWSKTRGDERKPWKVSKLQRQGPVPMLISQAHLPTNKCSKSQRCVRPWTAESQVKQGVRRFKLWRRHLHPSDLCEKLWPLTWTCQCKQTNKIEDLYSPSLSRWTLPSRPPGGGRTPRCRQTGSPPWPAEKIQKSKYFSYSLKTVGETRFLVQVDG